MCVAIGSMGWSAVVTMPSFLLACRSTRRYDRPGAPRIGASTHLRARIVAATT